MSFFTHPDSIWNCIQFWNLIFVLGMIVGGACFVVAAILFFGKLLGFKSNG